MKRVSLFLFLVSFICVSFGFQVNLDPSHLDVVMKAGSTARKSLTLSNGGTEALQVKVYLNDWVLGKKSKSFLPAGSTAYSLQNKIKIFPTSFNLNPNESKSVVLSFTSQSDDPDGQYGVVFFEVQPSQTQKGSGVSVGGRIGTLVSKETEGKQNRQLNVTNASVKIRSNKVFVNISAVNPTPLLVMPKVTLVLTNSQNDIRYKGTLPSEWTLLPNASQAFSTTVVLDKKIVDKDLTALFSVDVGSGELIMKECKVVIE